jgi:hypothetical protein
MKSKNQQAFEKSALHILTQKRQCTDKEGRCCYAGPVASEGSSGAGSCEVPELGSSTKLFMASAHF